MCHLHAHVHAATRTHNQIQPVNAYKSADEVIRTSSFHWNACADLVTIVEEHFIVTHLFSRPYTFLTVESRIV